MPRQSNIAPPSLEQMRQSAPWKEKLSEQAGPPQPISGWSRAKQNVDKLMLARALKHAEAHGEDCDKVNIAPWRIHDLRRTGATRLERLGVRLQVVEALLGHTAGSRAGVVGIYQLHTYEEEKRAALEKWAENIASLTTADALDRGMS